ncbi:MAG: PD-(D/E)XK nuclease family protein, partial [Acidobacteriota bacterium]|nr:PD-(D/E)XK nuclease family protein [Acidobacteriota bacterium]
FGSHRAPHVLSNDVPVFGFIDCVVEHKDGTIELIDYKSQRAEMTQAEADNSIQAGIYLCVCRELFPGHRSRKQQR